MIHASEEQLVEAYYGDADEATRNHLQQCAECSQAFMQIKETLQTVSEYPMPELPEDYGSRVWARLQPRLVERKRRSIRGGWWILIPALAAVLAIGLAANNWWATQKSVEKVLTATTDRARERVLLLSIGDHLERSQIVLTELVHANPETTDLTEQRKLAAELVDENRLLRERAMSTGDVSDASLLEDVQLVLLDVANASENAPEDDLAALKQRMEDQSLLFKVRVTSMDARRKGQSL